MQVLLLYDFRERERYRRSLLEIVERANGRLDEIDVEVGAVSIEAEFRERSRTADVILVDVTKPNTNVGYEIGRCLRAGDRRLILFSCSRDAPSFYLRGYKVNPLDAVVERDPGWKEQANDLTDAIIKIGNRRPLESLGDSNAQGPVEQVRHEVYETHARVYKAPTAAFVFGEHAVTVGHPALHLPLPRYVFVAVDRSKCEQTTVRFLRPNASAISAADNLVEPFRSRLHNTLALWGLPPLRITVWSELPTMCGLGTSSAIAACLALEVLGRDAAPPAPSGADSGATVDLLASPDMNHLFRTAWKLDAAFHTFRGSGAGVFGALAGAAGLAPNLFFSDPRRTWNGDAGAHERNLSTPDDFPSTPDALKRAHEVVEMIPCVGFHTYSVSQPFQSGHFALVYSGHTKHTGFAVTSIAQMAKYFRFRAAMLRAILDGTANAGLHPRYPLSQRMTDQYRSNVASSSVVNYQSPEQTRQHEGAVQETLYAAYGCAALAGINSFWSGDDRFLALMNSCQTVLEAMGLHEWTEVGVANYGLYHLAAALNALEDARGDRACGAKITGGGMGGDLIVFSKERDPTAFEQILRQGILDARCRSATDDPAFGTVHFSSSWIDGYPSNYRAEPARLIKGESPPRGADLFSAP